MKRMIYISRSRLSRNLMGLVAPTVPKKLTYSGFESLDEAVQLFFPKPVQLLILDDNAVREIPAPQVNEKLRENPMLKNAKRILILSRDSTLNKAEWENAGFDQIYLKPFLPEELMTLLDKNLGHKK